MHTTRQQEAAFLSAVIPNEFLEQAISKITSDFGPDEIYPIQVLEEWATDNGYIKVED